MESGTPNATTASQFTGIESLSLWKSSNYSAIVGPIDANRKVSDTNFPELVSSYQETNPSSLPYVIVTRYNTLSIFLVKK
jgi:hypothetical protein